MTSRNAQTMSRKDFEHLLDVYGADRTRWPLVARASAAVRLATDAEARRLLDEAEALDVILLNAPEPENHDVAALTQRIVAAAVVAPRVAAQSDQPMELTAARQPVRRAVGSGVLRGTALLAASLMIGVFVGQTQLGATAVPAIAQLTGLAAPATTDEMALADFHVEAVDDD